MKKKISDIRDKIAERNWVGKVFEQFQVIDTRLAGFFLIENEFIKRYGKLGGPMVAAVYMSLCLYVNKDRVCWPSIDRIAEQWGMSPRNVIRCIGFLKDFNIIKVYSKPGKSNIYEILEKAFWKDSSIKYSNKGGGFSLKSCVGCAYFETPACEGCSGGSHSSLNREAG